MELKQYLATLWRWWWLILLSTLLAAASSYGVTRMMPRIYQAQATVIVGQSTQSLTTDYGASVFAERLAQTYIQLATTQPVLQMTIAKLSLPTGPGELASRVNVSPVPNTQLLRIRVLDTDPERAAATANGLAEVLKTRSSSANEPIVQKNRAFIESQLQDLETQIADARRRIPEMVAALDQVTSARALADRQAEITAEETKITAWRATYASLLDLLRSSDSSSISVVDPAIPDGTPVSPQTRNNVLLAAALGLVVSAAAAFLLDYLDDTVKDAEGVERVFGSHLLAAIARVRTKGEAGGALVTLEEPSSNTSEAYRLLRANVDFALAGKGKPSILITSAVPSEGKTFTAANLAVSAALAGKRVVLVDTDLRRPSLHRVFGLANGQGLSNLLISDQIDPEALLCDTKVEGLSLLASGPLPPNSAELLGSPRMDRVINRLAKVADLVLYDSPPLLVVADASLLASRIGQAILVVRSGRLRGDAAGRARAVLETAGAKLLGVVLNQVSRSGSGDYAYYGSYYSATKDQGLAARFKRFVKDAGTPPAEE